MTVAFEIPNPFLRPRKVLGSSYQPKLITIWHCDPETDGSDDSCGWTFPKISSDVRQQIKQLAESEQKFMIGECGYQMTPFELIYSIWCRLAWRLHQRSRLSHKELLEITDLAINPVDNLRHCCAAALEEKSEFERLFYLVYSCYLRLNRPWYQHPKYHWWHWKFQIHPWQSFKRKYFDRCAKCNKGFGWGETAHTCGDDDILYHSDCLHPPD